MAEIEKASLEQVAAATNVESKKSKKAKGESGGVKKPKSKPTHPPTAQMVNSAIESLKERGGSSLPAIKKYLTANYKVDAEKLAPFIKKYLKSAVISGKLIQTKGKGASGSFKLPSSAKTKAKSEGKKTEKKKSAVKKPKEKAAKSEKKKSEKKKVEKKKIAVSAAKSAKKAGTPKSKPSKLKQEKAKKEKTAKAASKKPKAPKPKKLAAPKKAVAKK